MNEPSGPKVTVRQAAKTLRVSPEYLRLWFEASGLRIWKRDKVLITDVALLEAEIQAVNAATADWNRLK